MSAGLTEALKDVTAGFDHAAMGEEIGRAACAAIPQLSRAGDHELVEETILAATSNVVAITGGLLAGGDAAAITAPPASLQWAEWLVSRNIDVSAIPWAYNFGQSRMTEAMRRVAAQLDLSAEDRWHAGDEMARYVNRYVESVCAQMVDHFVHAQERWQAGTPAVRRQVVEELLAGNCTDAAAAGASLGYALDRPHLAAIVWSNERPETRPAGETLSQAARSVLRACGAQDVLVVPNGQSSVWAWGNGSALRDLTLAGLELDPRLRAVVGSVGGGSEGFVRSHAEAMRARHLAGVLPDRPALVTFRSVALESLITSDPAGARQFLDAELGSLAQDSEVFARLRATLAVYLEEGMRPVRAARRLGVHQNTVAYRIAQAEEALGRPLSERRLELETALRLSVARDALSPRAPGADM